MQMPCTGHARVQVRYEAPHGWYAEHVDTRFTWSRLNQTYSERVIAATLALALAPTRVLALSWILTLTLTLNLHPLTLTLTLTLTPTISLTAHHHPDPRVDPRLGQVIAAIVQLSDRHEHAGDYSGGELQLLLRSGAVPAAPSCTCRPQPCRPQPCRPQPCRPQPCRSQPCRPQPCRPQPCRPQPCRQQ